MSKNTDFNFSSDDNYRQSELQKINHSSVDKKIRTYNNQLSIGIFRVFMVVMLLFLIGSVLSGSTSIPTFEGVLQVFRTAPLIDTSSILDNAWGQNIPIISDIINAFPVLNLLVDFINVLNLIGTSAANMLVFLVHFIGYIFSL